MSRSDRMHADTVRIPVSSCIDPPKVYCDCLWVVHNLGQAPALAPTTELALWASTRSSVWVCWESICQELSRRHLSAIDSIRQCPSAGRLIALSPGSQDPE